MAPPRLSLPLAGTLMLPLLLGACGGTPFGDALSRSFSRAPAAAVPAGSSPAEAPGAPAASTPAAPPRSAAGPPTPATPARPPATAPSTGAPAAASRPAATPPSAAPARPAPYRVTIRLPEADPSAP
ncbi:MAG: hypothetical protein ER33_02870, partial [Cyanobium sp. CACIAM 14]